MNNVRDAGAALLAAAEQVYAEEQLASASARSEFIAKEKKLLLLFAHNTKEADTFKDQSEALRKAAESKDAAAYNQKQQELFESIGARVLKEWKSIKRFI